MSFASPLLSCISSTASRAYAGFPEQTVCVAQLQLEWTKERVRQEVGVMDAKDGTNVEGTTYMNLLLLGAIAAASAFVVTILIVLVCVGCQK